MKSSDYIKKSDVINKANEAIAVLQKNQSDLANSNKIWLNIMSNNIIVGQIGDQLITHLLSIISLNSAFSNLLQMDIQDYRTLINSVSTLSEDKFDGSVIVKQYEQFDSSYRSALRAADDAKNINLTGLEGDALNEAQQKKLMGPYYEREASLYKQTRDEYGALMAEFDGIQASTSTLFTENNNLRSVVRDGYTALPKEWHSNGNFALANPTITFSLKPEPSDWKTRLVRVNHSYESKYCMELYLLTTNDNLTVKWDNVEKLLKMDPEEVNPYQYFALASLYSYLSDESMEKLFYLADMKDENNYHTLSQTLGRSIDYYNFMSIHSVDPSTWENNNDVLKATALKTAYDYLSKTTRGDKFLVTFKSKFQTNHRTLESIDIKIEFVEKEKTFWEMLLDAFASSPSYSGYDSMDSSYWQMQNQMQMQQLGELWERQGRWIDYTVMRHCAGESLDFKSSEIALAYIDDLGGSWGSFLQDQATGFVVDHLPDIMGLGDIPGISHLISLATLGMDAAEQHENRSNADAAIKSIYLGKIFEATDSGANIIQGDYNIFALGKSDTVTVTNINVNEIELARRITVYNDNHSVKLEYTDVLMGFYDALNGNLDLELLYNTKPTDNAFILFVRDYYENNSNYKVKSK